MVSVIGQLLPLMVTVALSSVPIMVCVTILLSPDSRRSALLFLVGWVTGIFIVTGLLTLGLQSLPRASSWGSEPAVGVGELIVGAGLIASGVVVFVRTHAEHPSTQLPKWLRAVGTIRPLTALGLALVLNLRPKALLLSTAAALIVGTSGIPVSEMIAALVIFAVVGASSVGVPVVLALVNPGMMRAPLESTRRWIVRNSSTVTLIVLLVIGTVIMGNGLGRL